MKKNKIQEVLDDPTIVQKYVNLILSDLENDSEFRDLLNKLMFSSELDICNVIKQIEIRGFHDFKRPKLGRAAPCTPEVLRQNNYSIPSAKKLDKYEVFECKVFNSYDDAVNNYPKYYFFVKQNFVDVLDRYFIRILSDFEEIKKGLYRKRISERLVLEFDNEREFVETLSDYSFPRMRIIYNEELLCQYMDPRRFLFVGDNSFAVFGLWANDIIYNDLGQMVGMNRKDDEPLIYVDEGANSYTITNSVDRIDDWNNYIETIVYWYERQFRIYESWLTSIFFKR